MGYLKGPFKWKVMLGSRNANERDWTGKIGKYALKHIRIHFGKIHLQKYTETYTLEKYT